jgi:hypothetical protein
MLERWYGRLSNVMDHRFNRNPIILYANHPDFQQTNVIGGELSQGAGGVTESNRREASFRVSERDFPPRAHRRQTIHGPSRIVS